MSTPAEPKAPQKSGYLPTLDGWRAIAIISVILSHEHPLTSGIFSTVLFQQHGYTGVDLFFAISGLLICTRLLEEEHLYGGVSLRRFYVRRGFRILPAAFLYLLVIFLLSSTNVIQVSGGEIRAALLFFRNYNFLLGRPNPHFSLWFTEHFWSLSVEEQFYLVLPALLLLTPRKARAAVLLGIGAVVILHLGLQVRHRPWVLILFHADVRIHELFLPAALSILLRQTGVNARIYGLLRWWPLIFLTSLLAILFVPSLAMQVVVISVLFPLTIAGSTLHAKGIAGRILESAPLRFIGRTSYGMYLWQQLFFTDLLGSQPLGMLNRWPMNLLATLVCALTSFYLLERPMMRLGHRFAPPATPGREDVGTATLANPPDGAHLRA